MFTPTKSHIELNVVIDETKLIKMKGITPGKLPGYDLDEILTVDVVKDLSPFEQHLIYEWTTTEYKYYRYFFTICNQNKGCYYAWLREKHPLYTKEELDKMVNEVLYNAQFLDNILNNQLKKDVLLCRVQEQLFDFECKKVGDKVIMKGYNSTAFTKEGMRAFQETSQREGWVIEIEAGKGTKGVYVSPLAPETELKNYASAVSRD